MHGLIEAHLEDLRDVVARGLGRFIGTDIDRPSPLSGLPEPVWTTSRDLAEELQAQDELGDFLLFLRPDGDFADPATTRSFDQDMNEVAVSSADAINQLTHDVEVPGITKEPVGLKVADVIATFRAVAISSTQERVAEVNYGLVDPLPCRDLLSVYRSGHVLCGYAPAGRGSVVLF